MNLTWNSSQIFTYLYKWNTWKLWKFPIISIYENFLYRFELVVDMWKIWKILILKSVWKMNKYNALVNWDFSTKNWSLSTEILELCFGLLRTKFCKWEVNARK